MPYILKYCVGRQDCVFPAFVSLRYHIKLPFEIQPSSSLHPLTSKAMTWPSADKFPSSFRAPPSQSFLRISHSEHSWWVFSSACVTTTTEHYLNAHNSSEASPQSFLSHSNLESSKKHENNCHRFPCGNKLYFTHFPQNVQFFSNKRSEIIKKIQLYDSMRNI